MKKNKAGLGIKFKERYYVRKDKNGFSEKKNYWTEIRIVWKSQWGEHWGGKHSKSSYRDNW